MGMLSFTAYITKLAIVNFQLVFILTETGDFIISRFTQLKTKTCTTNQITVCKTNLIVNSF